MKEQNKHRAITTLLVVLLAVVAINQYMLLTVNSVPRLIVLQGNQQSQQQQQTSQPILQAEPSKFGVPYNDDGYKQLLGFDKTISLSDAQKQDFVGLNVRLPCCGFQSLQAAGNCQCGHHIAMSGLAKSMLQDGYAKEEVQAELDKWKDIFYPGSSSGGLGGC